LFLTKFSIYFLKILKILKLILVSKFFNDWKSRFFVGVNFLTNVCSKKFLKNKKMFLLSCCLVINYWRVDIRRFGFNTVTQTYN
jgi:hypothetical protein